MCLQYNRYTDLFASKFLVIFLCTNCFEMNFKQLKTTISCRKYVNNGLQGSVGIGLAPSTISSCKNQDITKKSIWLPWLPGCLQLVFKYIPMHKIRHDIVQILDAKSIRRMAQREQSYLAKRHDPYWPHSTNRIKGEVLVFIRSYQSTLLQTKWDYPRWGSTEDSFISRSAINLRGAS